MHIAVLHFTLPTREYSRSPARLIGTQSRNTFTVVWPFAMPLVGSPWLENQSDIGASNLVFDVNECQCLSIYYTELKHCWIRLSDGYSSNEARDINL